MILSDKDIKRAISEGFIKIDPLSLDNIQGAAIYLELGEELYYIKKSTPVKLFEDLSKYHQKHSLVSEKYILTPGAFVLAETKEQVSLPDDLAGFVETKSDFAKAGLSVTLSSFLNPGYQGKIPLSIKNFGNAPVLLVAGMKICQLVLQTVSSEVEQSYPEQKESKYNQAAGEGLGLDNEIKELLTVYGIKLSDYEILKLQSWLGNRVEDSSVSVLKHLKEKLNHEVFK